MTIFCLTMFALGGSIPIARRNLNKARADRLKRPVEDINREMAAEVPLGRYGTAEEAADLIVFLGSDRATYITGTTIAIDGGLVRATQ